MSLPTQDLEFAKKNTLLVVCFGLLIGLVFAVNGWISSSREMTDHLKKDLEKNDEVIKKQSEAMRTLREMNLESDKTMNQNQEMNDLIHKLRKYKENSENGN